MLLRKIMRACHLFNFQYQIYWSIFLFFLPLAQLIFFLRITRVIVKEQVAHTGKSSKPTAAVLCPWARHFTPRKYWLITQEAVAPSRHDWKIVDWDGKPQHKQTNIQAMNQVFSA